MNKGGQDIMKWSWRVGEFLGIRVYVHATFLLLIGWIALTHFMQGQTLQSAVAGVLFTVAIFLSVLLHEYGHALAARRFGIGTRDITLLPIGGVARLERMPEEPKQELWVALAGPAVNVAISGALFVVLFAAGALQPLAGLSVAGGPFLERLMVANIFLVLFNLLPAFPMDGGRVLRALLATRLPYVKATKIAGFLGQGMALLFGLAGLFGNPFLVFIALFVWIGAAQESAAVEAKSALGNVPVGSAMITDFRHLSPGDPLSRAVALVLTGSQQDFPVVDGQRIVGILPRSELILALAQHGQEKPVGEVMVRTFESADIADTLQSAYERLQTGLAPALPVTRNGQLAGMITAENVGEFLMIRAALGVRATAIAGSA
jgi:Zn-dependent protease/predicted transcriptional regulator